MEILIGIGIGIALTFLWANIITLIDNHRTITLKRAETVGRLYEKMRQIQKLTKDQMDLYSQIDGPSKGAAWAKGANKVGYRIKDIEEQKLAIFKEMLSEGIDPTIGVLDSDGKTKFMKTSELIAESEATLAGTKTISKTDPKIDEKKDEKIVHIDFKKGNDNDSNRPPEKTD